jgi:transcriptional regulator with XRE-family HTH domain
LEDDPTADFVLWTGQVGANLRGLREARGWSQRELAKQARLSPETINQLEKGARPDISLSTMLKIQEGLGLASVELLLAGLPAFASADLARKVVGQGNEDLSSTVG